VTGGPGGDWDAIEEALEARIARNVAEGEAELAADRPFVSLDAVLAAADAVDPRHAEVERLRAELSDLYPAIESLQDELKRAEAEREKLRALLDPDNDNAVRAITQAIVDTAPAGNSRVGRAILAALREAAS
jgi:molecular chaperone GrpE (heat shock protein)